MSNQATIKFGLVIPTLNSGEWVDELISAIKAQDQSPESVVVIDSASEDGSDKVFLKNGFEVIRIDRSEFDHGGTRQSGVERLSGLAVIIFLTQDAIPADPGAFGKLLSAFSDPEVGVAFGRQLPRDGAGPIESHARIFNYADVSRVDTMATSEISGLRAAFCSNSFAAYRAAALEQIGGFPKNCIFGEDMIAAIQLMSRGWKKAYVAGAAVKHSHSYNLTQDFKRYFDIGCMHVLEKNNISKFKGVSGEGFNFLKSEILYLSSRNPLKIPESLFRTALKLVGYHLGRSYSRIPNYIVSRISMNRRYWSRH